MRVCTRAGGRRRPARGAALAGIVLAFGLDLVGSGDGAHGQTEDRWVLVDTQVNPTGEPPPASWDVTTTVSSMTVVTSFGPDDTSGAEALFEASWTPPPATLEPGAPLVIPVTVSGRNTGNLDTQYFFGLDVIMLVDDTWNDQAVGAGASCAQTTVISGEYVCSDPVTNTGEMRTIVATYGDSYSVGVSALNCSGACWVRWAYERVPAEQTETTDAQTEGTEATTDETVGGTAAPEDAVDPDGVFGAGEGLDDVGQAVIGAAVVAAAATAAAVTARRRAPRRSRGSDEADEDEDDKPREVVLELTYPAGVSPYVFQRGWLFGARAIVAPGTPDARDVSDTVRWSGDAVFDPPVGRRSRPSFTHGVPSRDMLRVRASKRITLQVEVDGVTTETTTTLGVTGTAEYAHVTDLSNCPSDAHGCPACPHPTVGPIDTGSPTVLLNDLPAARVGDHGIAAACCGPNQYTIATGDATVLIDGRPAAHVGSVTAHCGGIGSITTGSPN